MNDLLPCPFCGGEAHEFETEHDSEHQYQVQCRGCGAEIAFWSPWTAGAGQRATAALDCVERWNRRQAEDLTNRRAYQVGYAVGQAAALRSAPPVGARVIAEKAYLAGFNAAGEGYNGEWPFHDKGISPDTDEGWLIGRDMAIAALLPAGEGE